ncbi:MAG: hypothetical protein WCI71_17000, partial [Bacteroidota bacterium]
MIRKIGLKLLDITINLVYTTFSFFMILIFSKKTEGFVKHLNQESVILGNGPSLLEDLKKIENNISDKFIICLNNFALSEYYMKLKPSVYVFNDPFYWSILDATKISHSPVISICDELFERILNETTWPITIYTPFEFKKSKLYIQCANAFIEFKFFNSVPVQGFPWFINFCLKHRLGLLKAANVITPSLYYAIMSNFNTIYLIGVDHSWINSIVVLEDSKVYMAQPHFYDNDTSFNPVYLSPEDNESPKLYKLLEIYSNVFKNYWILADFARRVNCRIINLTEKSHVDAFPKS